MPSPRDHVPLHKAPALDAPLLEVRGLTKRFPGVVALSGVHLTLQRGEVLAVIGENGAGKSTLMKILAGVQQADEGEIRLDGERVELDKVETALDHGVALIHQELNLADNLDVGANIFLGREPRRWGFIDQGCIAREAKAFLDMVGLQVASSASVVRLAIGRRQLVEIAKALSTHARILIMDEPTSSLSRHEAEVLFAVVKTLRERGVSIVYISHRLGEVRELADRVLVLRDGENAGELGRDEIEHDRMVKLMVGRDVSKFYDHQPHAPGDSVLDVKDLIVPAHPGERISLSVRRGEIVGLAGLVGAGRSELLDVLFGVHSPAGGEMRIDGRAVSFTSPLDAIRAGVALAPEDRKLQGLILEMSVRENIGLPGLKRHQLRGGFLNRAQQQHDAAAMIAGLNIKTPSDGQIVQLLSGGNQQKVVLGKWLALKPKVLLLDEPTRGIDIGAKEEIYRLMERLAEAGVAILFASSEMEEILGMSDRALVMHEGRITGQLPRGELSEEAVMHLATGRTTAQTPSRETRAQ